MIRMKGYAVCIELTIERIYDEEKQEYTNELYQCARFRSYVLPDEYTKEGCIDMSFQYPLGKCPWRPGDVIEITGKDARLHVDATDLKNYRSNKYEGIFVKSRIWYENPNVSS